MDSIPSQRRSGGTRPSETLNVEVKLRKQLAVGRQFTLSLPNLVLYFE